MLDYSSIKRQRNLPTYTSQDLGTFFFSTTSTGTKKMERHRYRPSPGASFKLYHILDPFEDSATCWSPMTGLAAEDTSTILNTEEELIQSIVDYFCNYFSRPNPTPYVPAVLRQQVDTEALKQRVGEEILVLEIEVEKIMPEACIYPVRDVVTGCNLEWPGDPRSGWGSKYLILHRVPREAITVYTPDELLEKGEFCL